MFKPIYLLGAILGIMIYWSGPTENVKAASTHSISNTEGSLPKANSTTSASEMMLTIICDNSLDSFYLDNAGSLVLDSTALNVGAVGGVAPYSYEILPTNTFDCMSAGNVETIKIIVSDASGAMDSCEYDINILDNTTPVAKCKNNFNFGIGSNPYEELSALYFLDGKATDNCAVDSVSVSRLGGECYPGDDTSGVSIFLCCEDVDTDVEIWLEVFDESGNRFACSTIVSVHDSLPPMIEYGLPDITVSCDFFIDPKDLSPFGTVVFDPIDRDTIFLDDPLYNNMGLDALVIDNCEVLSIESDTAVDNRFNNVGDIERAIVVTDSYGRSVIVEQTITIVDLDSLELEDIIFPNDTTIVFNSCSDSIPAHMTGEPIIEADDICTMVAFEHEDLVFDSPNSGCIFVKRTWTVIDMAKYQPNANPPTGIFTNVQYITVNNTEPPIIDSITSGLDYTGVLGACDVLVEMSITAVDSCTNQEDLYFQYFIDYDRDGIIDDDGENDSLSVIAEVGDHRVIWKVEDRCGNVSKYEVDFTAREGKAPVPVCYNGLSADLSNVGTVEVWASDFDAGSYDNCTADEDLVYSFSPSITDGVITYTCEDKGQNDVTVYVTDEEGNQSLCLTTILITDNLDPCPILTPTTHKVGGLITTEEDVSIPETKISISDLIETNQQMSDEKGKFMFDAIPGQKDYVLNAQKNDQCLEGVSTLDLVLIQRHILNQEKLQSPFKLLAADVNSSGKVSASDLVELRKLILGISDSFKDSDCWIFIDKNFVFEDPKSPWDYPKGQELNTLDIDLLSTDFTAVKLGDVNGSVSNIHEISTENRSPQLIEIFTSDKVFEEGEEIEIPIYAQSHSELLALQANFSFAISDLEFIGLEGNQIEINSEIYHSSIEESLGHVTIAYSNNESVDIEANQPLFNFVFMAKNRGRLSNVFTENSTKLQGVAYDSSYEQLYLNFKFDEENLKTIELGVPSPNPFIGQTQIDLGVATSSYIEFELFNQSGTKLYGNGAFFPAGRHKLEITDEMLNGNKGVLYLHVSGPESHSVIKLIRIE